MKAMILAAGLGKRMRPLTDHTPKPLLRVAGKPLLDYHLEALGRSGIEQVVINIAYLGEQIRAHAGNGERYGLEIRYSKEPEPLETGGALLQALPLLGDAPFLLVNADVWTDFPIAQLAHQPLPADCLGRLLLVPNPPFHPEGDFALSADGRLHTASDQNRHTYAGISLLRPALIADYPRRRRIFPLLEALKPAIDARQLQGELYSGHWSDVGTPERLQLLEQTATEEP